MSKETEPIRSRRELREQSARAAGAGVQPTVPASPAQPVPAVPAQPVPQTAPRGERESQTRARDRAALRAYKELVDPPAMNPLPSRRALRQAQLDADRAPITALNPVITAAAIAATKPAAAKPDAAKPAAAKPDAAKPAAAKQAAAKPAAAKPAAAKQAAAPAAPATPPAIPATPPAAPKTANNPQPVPVQPQKDPAAAAAAAAGTAKQGGQPPLRSRSGRRAAAVTVPGGNNRSAAAPSRPPIPTVVQPEPAPPAPAAEKAAAAVAPKVAPVTEASPGAAAGSVPATGSAATPAPTHSQDGGLPAGADNTNYPPMPGLVSGGSYYPVSAGPPPASTPSEEDLKVLAAQKAEAERAAVLNQRAQARERLAQESAKSKRQAADPTATDNLAMVTPLEFVDVPGSSRPVLRQPATTHVPIVTRATPKQTPPRPRPAAERPAAKAKPAGAPAAGQAPAAPNANAERFDAALAAREVHRPGPGNRPLTGGRSGTLKKAEAMATGGMPAVMEDHAPKRGLETSPAPAAPVEVQRSQMPPMPADSAHGLEPLNAMTAGLGRTQRNLLIQWGSVLVGGIALIVGAIMFFTS